MLKLIFRPLKRAICCLIATAAIVPAVILESSPTPNYGEVRAASQFFTGRSLDEFFKYLDEVRPAAQHLDAQAHRTLSHRLKGIATATGQITEAEIESYQKRFSHIFSLHQRQAMILIIFPDQHPSAAIHGSKVIAISTRSVELAESQAGLAGMIAHEVAHEYLTSPRLTSLLDQDARLDREIELVCDGIAVASLLRLGMSPEAYAHALSAQIAHQKNSPENIPHLYPSLSTRLEMIRSVAAEFRDKAKSSLDR
jgi:hypothetical protein